MSNVSPSIILISKEIHTSKATQICKNVCEIDEIIYAHSDNKSIIRYLYNR